MACGVSDPGEAGGDRELTSTLPEPAGAHCAAGGVVISSGADVNGNGILDPDETETTAYVCSHKTLLREDNIASGAVCPGGGVIVHSGHDVDDNGLLADSEIEGTATVCYSDELFHGDLKTSEFATAAAQEKLSHVRIVTGDVLIDSTAAMPSLELVGGQVELQVGTLVRLPALAKVAGSLIGPPPVVPSNEAFLERIVLLDVPALANVGGRVSMTSWVDGGTFSAPALDAVDGELVLNGHFTTIDLHHLKRIGSRLQVTSRVASLALPALEHVGGSVQIGGELASLELPVLASAAAFDLRSSHLSSLTLPSLRTISQLRIGDNLALTSVELPAVTGLSALSLYRLPQLATFEAPQVTALGSFQLRTMTLSNLQLFGSLRSIAAVTIENNPQLVDLTGLEQLTSVTTLTIAANDKLASLVGLEQLTKVAGDITIKNNASLASLAALAELTSVTGQITVADNAALPQSDVDAFLKRLGR